MTSQIDELIKFPVRFETVGTNDYIFSAGGSVVAELPWPCRYGQFLADAINEKYERGRIPVTPEDFERAGYEDIGGGVWKRKDLK